jgi:hypothetical protein
MPVLEAPRTITLDQDPNTPRSADAPLAGRLPLLEVATSRDFEAVLEQRKVFNLWLIVVLGILEVITGIVVWLKVASWN